MSIKKLLKLYAVTSCHAGSGSSLGIVDLPIQREKHTNWPIIQASGVKGAMRMHCYNKNMNDINSIFGNSEGNETESTAGSFSITDARILAFPVRSNIAPFVWIICPAVLKRLNKDLEVINLPAINLDNISFENNEVSYFVSGNFTQNQDVLVEDMPTKIKQQINLNMNIFDGIERLIIVSDEVFNYAVENCTQIMAQIKINEQTGTTKDGSLRYIEELPSDTVMYSLINIDNSKSSDNLTAEKIMDTLKETIKNHIQIAGEQTNGRGIFEITWIDGGNK